MVPQLHRSRVTGVFGLLVLLGLSACGGGGGNIGGGGCGGGSSLAGIVLCVTSVQPKYQNTLTPSVDIVQGICPDGQPEFFADHSATVTISATLSQGATQPPVSNTVTLTHYTIEYTQNPGVTGPNIKTTGNIFDTIVVPVTGTATRDVALMTTQQKDQFLADLGLAGGFDGIARPYAVTYTFFGQDGFGNNMSARGFGQIVIGSYNNC